MEGNREINIQHPEAWELLVLIEDKRVRYILFTPTVDGSLIIGDVERTDDTLQGLEDAIYETPVLLNEYRRVRVLVCSSHFVLLPGETPDDDCHLLARQTFVGDDGDVAVNELPGGVKLAYIMQRGMQAFLGRTFNYPELYHRLFPLYGYFRELNHGDDLSRMFLNLQETCLDMVIYRDGQLQCVNSCPYEAPDDAAYFVLNAWRAHGLDQLTDELQLTGNNDVRAAMTPMLRQYVKFVMPVVYPAAAMRLGRNAMQAPLELILLALCE